MNYLRVVNAPNSDKFEWLFLRDAGTDDRTDDVPFARSFLNYSTEREAGDAAKAFLSTFNTGQRYFAVVLPSDEDES